MNLRSHLKLTSRAARRAGLGLVALATLVPIGTAAGAVTQGTGCTDAGATVTCGFWAKSDSLSVPGGSVAVMGYSGNAADAPTLPGPTIVADAGDVVTVTLHNTLAVKTGMLFQEQAIAADQTGAPASGGTKTYTFTASNAGTYLYEASPFVTTPGGGGSQYQTAMGMSGALVVRPATPGQAYDSTASLYDAEHLVVVSELDKDITAANAAAFDMRKYSPDYFLVNGKASPDTATLPANAGDLVLLRWVDAGIKAHSVAVLGAAQRVVGEDGNALANPRDMVAETIGAGQTEDVIVTLASDASGKLPVYDAGLWLNNNTSAGMGGALTFLDVTPGPASADDAGPGTSGVAFTDPALSASVSDAATGGANVTAAEYFLDAVGANGAGTAMSGAFGAPTVAVSASIAALPAGNHTIYVHGQDSNGNWGPVSSLIYANADTAGPLTRSVSLSPDPSNGSKNVALDATGDDSATGGSDVTDAEYTIDGGTAVAIASNGAGAVSAIDTIIPAATVATLGEGAHTVSVRSRDAANNWGAPATVTLQIDKTGPVSTDPSTNPAASNGVQGVSASTAAVRVKATVTDPTVATVHSTVVAGEGFIDSTSAADGSGFPLVPADGTFNGVQETLRADIPLTTVTALAEGSHTIYLHGRDSSGNWGARVGTSLVVDKHAPTVSGLAATPNPTNNNASNLTFATATNNRTFTLSANSTDNLTAIVGAEWYSGTDPGAGGGTAMTVGGGPATWNLSATVDFVALGWLDGNRTISVRSRDAAGNWSTPITVTVTIVRPNVIFTDGFESGSGSAWSSRTGTSRLAYVTAANMAGTGTVGMRVALATGPGASGYVTDNTPVAEPTYHARFYFNPNNSTPGGGANGITILGGYGGNNGGGGNRFTVSYRLSGGDRQVRLTVVRSNNATNTTSWYTVPNTTPSRIEVYWRAGNSTTATLTVDPSLPGPITRSQILTGLNTGNGNRIESVRLGAQGLTGSNRAGSLYLDSFVSTRRTVVGP
jgi:FtsP/CotA-like multicopper oxidase with cupredoxin domain